MIVSLPGLTICTNDDKSFQYLLRVFPYIVHLNKLILVYYSSIIAQNKNSAIRILDTYCGTPALPPWWYA